jgi:hypothetical protein
MVVRMKEESQCRASLIREGYEGLEEKDKQLSAKWDGG